MANPAFSAEALAAFEAAYPLVPTHLTHGIQDHPLLKLEALAELAQRMRLETLEHNAAVGLKLGISNAETPQNGLSVAETIERIEECGSWVLLKYIEQDPAYAQLMRDVLAEIEPIAQQVTYGWGMIPATVTIGGSKWDTALWPKDGTYIVPVKTWVRRAERLELGDAVDVVLDIARG